MNRIIKSTRGSDGEIRGGEHLRGGIAEWWCSAAGGSRDAGARAVLETRLREMRKAVVNVCVCVCIALISEGTTRERESR